LDLMELAFSAATDVGRQRTHNEDNFLIDKKLGCSSLRTAWAATPPVKSRHRSRSTRSATRSTTTAT
jgi:serine/threonine protein phosphatase PrpC